MPVSAAPSASLPVAEAPGRAVRAVRGVVVDGQGRPLASALVALVPPFAIEGETSPPVTVFSGADGRFELPEVPPGRYGLTATAPDLAAAYGGVVSFPLEAPLDTKLVLGTPGARLQGKVMDAKGAALPGAFVCAARISENEGDVFVAQVDAAGRYTLSLPSGAPYLLVVDAKGLPRTPHRIDRYDVPTELHLDLALESPAAPHPSDAAIEGWLRKSAIPWAGVDPTLPLSDLEPVRAVIGAATLVGLGEATHGASEMFRTKHRLVAYLVEKMGFRVFAMEVGWAEALQVNDYVVHGKGDAESAVRGLVTWAWENEEVVALVRYLRAYNADPKHRGAPVSFQGFDVVPPNAANAVLAYLKRVDPAALAEAAAVLAPFQNLNGDEAWGRPEVAVALASVVRRFDEHRDAYVAASSARDFKLARHHAVIVQNAAQEYVDPTVRDTHMAEHVAWLVDDSPPGTKFVLWAHNAHISTRMFDVSDLGVRLRQRYGPSYLAIGFAFDHGSFRAMDWRSSPPTYDVQTLSLGASPKDSLGAALGLAGLPVFLVDLRSAPDDVRPWLDGPIASWQLGGAFRGEGPSLVSYPPRRSFDALIYLREITAARALPKKSGKGP